MSDAAHSRPITSAPAGVVWPTPRVSPSGAPSVAEKDTRALREPGGSAREDGQAPAARDAGRVAEPTSRSRRVRALMVLPDAEPEPEPISTFEPRPGLPPGGRDECRHGERPCPYVRCRMHLWFTTADDRGGMLPNGRPKPSVLKPRWTEEPTPPSCALDIAEARAEADQPPLTLEQIAHLLGLNNPEWVSGILRRAQRKARVALEKSAPGERAMHNAQAAADARRRTR